MHFYKTIPLLHHTEGFYSIASYNSGMKLGAWDYKCLNIHLFLTLLP